MTNLLQSTAWQKLQEDLGKTTFFKETADFCYLATVEKTPTGNYLYVPYGPEAATKEGFNKALEELTSLAKSKSAMFIRIEPKSRESASEALKKPIFRKSTDLNPAHTWVLDLTAEKEAIISGFSQGTRTRYNQAANKGLSVEVSKNPEDIKHLVRLQRAVAQKKGINAFSEDYLKTELSQDFASLYLVHYKNPETSEDKIIAASLFFDYAGTRYYMQSAADYEYRKLPATVALLTSAIFDAKEKGLKFFDFWGIAPEGAPEDHPWAGFTAFKKSFGGYEVDYCGTYDMIISSTKYRLYKALRKVNRIRRKI